MSFCGTAEYTAVKGAIAVRSYSAGRGRGPGRRARRRTAAQKWLIRVLAVLLLANAALFAAERRIRPVMLSVLEYESKRYAYSAFDDALAEHIAADPDAYQNLYEIEKADDGSIAAVAQNTYAVNRLETALCAGVKANMAVLEAGTLTIPAGTLTGVQLLAGRGPHLRLWMLPEYYVAARVYDTLESAGINQTKLCVYVRFEIEMSVVMAGFAANVSAENDVCVSQLLIVGQVPQSYWGRGS